MSDMLSGYRVFSRRFVKSFPALSAGFETETEFTIHALDLAMPLGEVETPYKERPAGLAGTYHVVARGETTWHDYAHYVIAVAREKGIALKTAPENVLPITTEAYPLPAKRPRNSRLTTSKLTGVFGMHLPDWRIHVHRLIEELALQGGL